MTIELTIQDIKILDLLQRDSDRSSADVAEKLNISQSPAWRRINRLEDAGVIEKKVALLNRDKLGMELVAFTTINLSQAGRQNMEMFETAVKQLDEVIECYTMTGAWDYMLKVVVKDIRRYEQFVEIKNTTELPLRQL